ncbi:dual specificity protein phosphatase family protein [Microbacterium sp. A1-JK]|uniref:dual specificity protein phosphatase family protein n=1 Tax=Microbacterium sp. A1-JK TaxID=3177516 RepID=UPI00388586B6
MPFTQVQGPDGGGQHPLQVADAVRVTESLWIGGELHPTAPATARSQLEELCSAGIDSIIDCRYERDDIAWVTDAKPQIDYLHIGVKDAGQRMPDSWFDDGTEYALEQIDQGHVVLAHCQAGINRGPSIAYAILIAQGWDAVEALDHIRSSRPIARIGYAEDAVHWWFSKIGAPHEEVQAQIDRVRQWRIDNQLPRRSDKGGFVEPA